MSNGLYDNVNDDDELVDPSDTDEAEQTESSGEAIPQPVTSPEEYIANTRHVATRNAEGDRILNGINLDSGSIDWAYRYTIQIYFGDINRAIEVWNETFNNPNNNNTENTTDDQQPDVGDVAGFLPDASEEDAKKSFNQREQIISSNDYSNILAGGTNSFVQPDRQGLEESPANQPPPDNSNSNPPAGVDFVDGESEETDTTLDAPPQANPVLGSTYNGIVRGWNEKLDANNVKLSGLNPFVELYAIFANDDVVFQGDTNRFTGVRNRLRSIKFVTGKNNIDDEGNVVDIPPPLPAGLDANVHVAKIGSAISQLGPDYYSNYTDNYLTDADGNKISTNAVDTGSMVKSYKGTPGISDLAVSRASSGAYNIKYDLSLTLPNPEILNEQYEYSKLLLLNSSFLLLHGWNIKDTNFTADRYPPNLQAVSDLTVDPEEVVLGSGNNGYWSASIINLMNFTFEFDNVGHLVGKLRFLTSQGAFMSAVSTDMVSTKMLDLLKEVPQKILSRGTGSNIEEKQKFIFANGVPWSKADFSNQSFAVANSAAELAIREGFRALNDKDLFRGGDLSASYFSGDVDENGDPKYSFERYKKVKFLIQQGVSRAANALRDIWYIFDDKKGRGIVPLLPDVGEIGLYAVPTLDPRFLSIERRDGAGSGKDWDKKIKKRSGTGRSERDRTIEDDFVNSIYIARKNNPYSPYNFGRTEELGKPRNGSSEENPHKFVRGLKTIMRFPSDKSDDFGNKDLRNASKKIDWDPFLYPDGNDLRNYYYNCILLDYVDKHNQDEEERTSQIEEKGVFLSVILPAGFVQDKDTGRLVFDNGDRPVQSDENILTLLRGMGRGQIIDRELETETPTFTGPPTVDDAPIFGSKLQGLIFGTIENDKTHFNSIKNLNYPNFSSESRYNVFFQNGTRDSFEEVYTLIKNSSVISIPTLVTAPENPAPPDIPNSDNLIALLQETLMIINIVRRRVQQKDEDGNILASETPKAYSIEIPNGYAVQGNNIYSFANGAGDTEFDEAVGDLKKNAPIIIRRFGDEGEDLTPDRFAGGNNDFFITRKVVVLRSGYTIIFDKLNPNVDFTGSAPRKIVTDDGDFIPELGNLQGDPDISQSIKDTLQGLKDSVITHVRQSSILTQRELGNTANIDVEISGVQYNVIMRPTYFFLGSVLEALSLSVNRTVKFYYKPLPIRTGEKAFTIPIPQRGSGDKLKQLEDQILSANEQIVKLGGEPVIFKGKGREFYISKVGQTAEEEAEAVRRFNVEIVEWHRDFSEFMRQFVDDGAKTGGIRTMDISNSAYEPPTAAPLSLGLISPNISTSLQATVGVVGSATLSPRIGPHFPIIKKVVGFVQNDLEQLGLSKDDAPQAFVFNGATTDLSDVRSLRAMERAFNNYIEKFIFGENAEQAKVKRDGYIAHNRDGKTQYYFYIFTDIRDHTAQLILNRGIYFLDGEVQNRDPITSGPDSGRYLPLGSDIVMEFMNNDSPFATNKGRPVPGTNANLKYPISPASPGDETRIQNMRRTVEQIVAKHGTLGFDSVFNSLEIKTPFEIPIEIGAVEQILTAEGGAPTHSLLKKLLSAASNAMPQLNLSMKPSLKDSSYIEIFVNAINVDGVIQEVFTEIDVKETEAESVETGEPFSPDGYRRSIQRNGSNNSYLKSDKVMVCNFGTMDSLVENFQLSSKIDANAFATFRLPSVMGGVSMDIGKILSGVSLNETGILNDIVQILNRGPIGGQDALKELKIVNDDGEVDDEGINNLTSILTNTSSPILRKGAQSFIEDLMSQDVKFYSKIMALQGEYFNGLSEASTNDTDRRDGQRFAGSKFYGNILNTYLRTATLTIHGTVGLNVFDYIYLKGLLKGVEGLYIINSVNESVTPTSFTTTLECKLVEYVENREDKNPLAYRGTSNFERFAEIKRGLRLDDATIPPTDFNEIVAKIQKIDDLAD